MVHLIALPDEGALLLQQPLARRRYIEVDAAGQGHDHHSEGYSANQ